MTKLPRPIAKASVSISEQIIHQFLADLDSKRLDEWKVGRQRRTEVAAAQA